MVTGAGEAATMDPMETPANTVAPIMERAQRILRERGLEPAPVPEGETDADALERLRTQAENRAARWRRRLPAAYSEATVARLDPEQHRDEIAAWVQGDGPNLILAGSVGTGKTYAAYAIGNDALNAGRWVEAVSVHDLLYALRPDGDRAVASGALNADVLVLDDLGASKPTEFAVDEITHLLGERLNHGRRTITTTNRTSEALRETWGERLVSRLAAGATVLVFTGPDRRLAW